MMNLFIRADVHSLYTETVGGDAVDLYPPRFHVVGADCASVSWVYERDQAVCELDEVGRVLVASGVG